MSRKQESWGLSGWSNTDPESRRELTEAHNHNLDGSTIRLEAKYCKDQEELVKQLQNSFEEQTAALKAEHRAKQTEWESMLERRDRDSKLFTFTVQGCEGPGLSGCLPRQIFNAEPDSALAHIYNGEWQYSTDDRGRAIINSDPAHGPSSSGGSALGQFPATQLQSSFQNADTGSWMDCWQPLVAVLTNSAGPSASREWSLSVARAFKHLYG
ncbi:hypothetical protein WJX74_005504 [Apatococcus lobatus]|uniref:Uncharacterized protein n=1 Tax=Apatococcus lobatus TaxID=904363 RepID=A0AAW1RSQ0_9CHLO